VIAESIDQITAATIRRLVDNRVPEGRTLEYKSLLPGSTDEDKREFLFDASSFANANGGDIVFGISDERKEGKSTGVPEAIAGINTTDVSAEIPRLENLLRDCISPRVGGIEFRPIDVSNGQAVLVLRIPRSWIGPHMVTFRGASRFYSRNAAGKSIMDVSELRTAFALSSSLPEKLKAFRTERILHIEVGEGPAALPASAKIVLHFVPLSALDSTLGQDFTASAKEFLLMLSPIGQSSCGHRFNFDGFLVYSVARSPVRGYVQLFRSGIVEVVDTDLAELKNISESLGKLLPGTVFEREMIGGVQKYLGAQRKLGVSLPIFFMLSLNGVKDYTLASSAYHRIERIDRDLLLAAPLPIEDFDVDVPALLHTTFDSIWQAAGAEGSPNYDSKGEWSPRR